MKTALVIVTLSTLLSACAGLQPKSAQHPDEDSALLAAANETLQESLTSRLPDADTTSIATGDMLPALDLTEDLMFKILRAEIAFQRGQWQSAYLGTLTLAQQTRDPRLARRATEMALSVKQPAEALSAIRLWRELAPNSEEATQYFLGLILLSDNIDEARPLLEQRLKNVSPQARGLLMFQVQRLLARAKNTAAAFSMLEDLVKPYLSAVEAHIALAQGAIVIADEARAQSEIRAALALQPDSELAALMMVQVTRDRAAAVQFLASFLTTHPKANDVRLAYARLLVDQKQYAKARQEFEILLPLKPQNPSLLYELGLLSMQTDDLKNGEMYLTAYLSALTSHPEDEHDPAQALWILTQIAEDRRDFDAAFKWLAQIGPGEAYFGAQIKRAQLTAKRGDIEAARDMLVTMHSENEREQAQIVLVDAQILRAANQTIEAFSVLTKGLVRFPNNTDLLYDYAMTADKLDRLDLMESTLRKALALAPDNQQIYNALGYSLADHNVKLNEAYTLIEKALSLAPQDPFIMDSMGWVQFRLGQLKEAEDLLRRAYAIRADPDIAAHLGEVLWVKGQKEDAQKLWRDAKGKDPKNDTLKSTLARLHVEL